MQRTSWKPFKCRIRGVIRWQFYSPDGKRQTFRSREAAELEIEKQRVRYHAEGIATGNFSEPQRRDALNALALLPAGHTLREAVTWYAKHVASIQLQLEISDAVARFLRSLEHRSPTHRRDLESRLTKFAVALGGRFCHEITAKDVGRFLEKYQGQNQKNYRTALHNLFAFLHRLGAISENPVTNIRVPKFTRRDHPDIMPVEKMRAYLRWAEDESRPDVLAWLVLGGFCGLRPFEALWVQWRGIQFETDELRIEKDRTKIKRARVFRLTQTAVQWLRLIHTLAVPTAPGNLIMPASSTWSSRWTRWRRAHKDLDWWRSKDDVLRHSYGSYRRPLLQNSAALAEEMGTSVAMINEHYDAVVAPSKAQDWWQILPQQSANVIPFAASR